MNDYDTPEIRCSLRNLSRVTEWIRTSDVLYGICRGLPSVAPPLTYTNTFHASLTEEYPQRDVITSELGTCVLLYLV